MAHDHAHAGASHAIEQISSVAICGLLGGVSVMMWQQGRLWFLATPFQTAVLVGGIGLLLLVVVRAVTLWLAPNAEGAHVHDFDHDHHHHDHDHQHHHHDHDHHHHHDHDHHHHAHDHHHDHDHHHHHDHGHAHAHSHDHGHGHDHGHDHGWNPWRFCVLLIPAVLWGVNLPPASDGGFRSMIALSGTIKGPIEGLNENFIRNVGLRLAQQESGLTVEAVGKDSAASLAGVQPNDLITKLIFETDGKGKKLEPVEELTGEALKKLSLDDVTKKLEGDPRTSFRLTVSREGKEQDLVITRNFNIQNLGFKDLEAASYDPVARKDFEGMVVRLKGQFVPTGDSKRFTLVRMKITCCAADAISLNVVIRIDPKATDTINDVKPMQWVEATGQVQFAKNPKSTKGEYIPVVTLASRKEGLQLTDPDTTPFLQQ